MKTLTKVLWLVSIAASALILGCIGQSNLTVTMPENAEVSVLKKETLNVELLPLGADANNVMINLTGPPEILLGGLGGKSFEKLYRGQKVNISFDYIANSAGDFNITLEAKANNAKTVNRTLNISAFFPLPVYEVGEFWVYNETTGDETGLHVSEVIRKELVDGKEYYVSKGTWEGVPNGTYSLSYASVEEIKTKKSEYYEFGSLVKEKTLEVDPPSADVSFPFKVGKRWSWNGTMTGLGKGEITSEVVRKESITVPAGTFTSYYINHKMALAMGTGTVGLWYVPELKAAVKAVTSVRVLNIAQEKVDELVEYGKPPAKPKKIQMDVKVPPGYKLFKNDKAGFSIAYPATWQTGLGIGRDYFTDGLGNFFVEYASIGDLTLENYRDGTIDYLKKLGYNVRDVREVEVNDMRGYQWYTESATYGKGKDWVFISEKMGYYIGSDASFSAFARYEQIFDSIIGTFFIRSTS